MDQPISRPMHGLLTDYPYVAAVSTAPETVGFADEAPVAAALYRVMAGAILASSLFTRAEWGLVRVMPYKAHLALDAGVGLFALTAPWLFGFAQHQRARNTFLAMGIVGLAAGTMSRRDEMPPTIAKRATPRAKYERAIANARMSSTIAG